MRNNSIPNRTWTGLVALLIALPILLLLFLIDLRPAVTHPGPLSTAQRNQIENLIVDNSPEQFRSTGQQQVKLTAAEINLLGQFLLGNIRPLQEVATHTQLEEENARLRISIPRQTGPLRWHLNIDSQIGFQAGEPVLRRLRIGQLPLPAASHELLLGQLRQRLAEQDKAYGELLELQHSIRSVSVVGEQLQLQLHWEHDLLAEIGSQAQQALLGTEEQQRILHYYRHTLQIADALRKDGQRGQLQDVLPALFEQALYRSSSGEQAAQENRALLQALTIYSNRIDPGRLFGESAASLDIENTPLPLRLRERPDLGRHFVTAAAISASAGTVIAEVLSSSKELHDARHSTGFSFSDMTANLAGVRFGELARDAHSARHLQLELAAHPDEGHYMPAVNTANDGLDEATLHAEFGDRDSERFQQEIDYIEKQISRLALYRETTVQ